MIKSLTEFNIELNKFLQTKNLPLNNLSFEKFIAHKALSLGIKRQSIGSYRANPNSPSSVGKIVLDINENNAIKKKMVNE